MKNEQNQKKKKFQFPDAYGIMFIFLILAAIATYLIPAG